MFTHYGVDRDVQIIVQKFLETFSLFILLGLVALRPLIAESYDSSVDSISGALQGVSQPSPLITLLFDLSILVATLGWLVGRLWVKTSRSYAKTGLEWGGIVVLVAAICSCVFAGNQRLAINGAIDWLCYPLMAIVLVQLIHRPWHRTLLLSVVLASAFAQSVECFDQYFIGFEDTWEHYESIKENFWAQQGVDLSDSKVELFENRIKSNEASGFMPHSNIAGSYLLLCSFVAAGVLISLLRRSEKRSTSYDGIATYTLLGLIIASGVMIVALVFTQSLGAWLAVGAGASVCLVLYWFRNWITEKRCQTVLIGWLLLLLGVGAVAGHGWYHDSLPGSSLMFRWQYWRNSAGMIADHPLAGVGRENFGRHYLRTKSIDSPEEVSNPHNLFVQAAADWGFPGLIGLLFMLFGVSFYVTRPIVQTSESSQSERGPPSKIVWLGWIIGLMIVIVVLRLPLLGSDDPDFVYFKTILAAVPWIAMFLCSACLLQTRAIQSVEGQRMMRMAVAIGLFSFLVHDMINFAMYVPATAMTFFALLAFCLSQSSEYEVGSKKITSWRRWCPIGFALAAILLVLYVGVIPVGRSMGSLSGARQSASMIATVPLTQQIPATHFDRAASVDPYDSTPLIEKVEWLLAVMQNPEYRDEAFVLADQAIAGAIQRDPHHLKLRRLQTLLYQQRSQHTKSKEDFHQAIDFARDALQLYPQDPHGLAVLADCYFEGGVETGDRDWVEQAADQYQNALDMDDRRLEWEKLQRFSQKQVDYIKDRLQQAKQKSEPRP